MNRLFIAFERSSLFTCRGGMTRKAEWLEMVVLTLYKEHLGLNFERPRQLSIDTRNGAGLMFHLISEKEGGGGLEKRFFSKFLKTERKFGGISAGD